MVSRLVAGVQWRSKEFEQRMVRIHMRLARAVSGGRPLSLTYWRAIRAVLATVNKKQNPLTPDLSDMMCTGASSGEPCLAELLQDDLLGHWTLDVQSIQHLRAAVARLKPRLVIECGAGVSTLVLADALREHVPAARRPRVISLEQGSDAKKQVEARVERAGLSAYSIILHAPLNEEDEYVIPRAALEDALESGRAEILVIDGPFGKPGCRYATLPALQPFCAPGASWYMDDALRDGELMALRRWRSLSGITVAGIIPVGKGLGTGTIWSEH